MSRHLPMVRERGVSLVELIVFIVVVTVGLAGVLSVFHLAVRDSADPLWRKTSLALAEAMMEDILSKDFQNDPADPDNTSSTLGCTPTTPLPCPANANLLRANYNDVDDYKGWNNVTRSLNQAELPLAIVRDCMVAVAVDPATALDGANAKRITVTATCNGEVVALQAYRGQF